MTFGITAGEKKINHTYTTVMCNGATAVNILPANPNRKYIILTAVRATNNLDFWPGDGLTKTNSITKISNTAPNDSFIKIEGPAAQLSYWAISTSAPAINQPVDIYQGT